MKFLPQIARIFDEAQRSRGGHSKCIFLLRGLRKEAKAGGSSALLQWDEAFFQCVQPLLLVFKKEPSVERCIEMIVRFATTNDEALSKQINGKKATRRSKRTAHLKEVVEEVLLEDIVVDKVVMEE